MYRISELAESVGLSRTTLLDYEKLGPLRAARLEALEPDLVGSRVLDDLRREIAVFKAGRGQFGYEMFVLERG